MKRENFKCRNIYREAHASRDVTIIICTECPATLKGLTEHHFLSSAETKFVVSLSIADGCLAINQHVLFIVRRAIGVNPRYFNLRRHKSQSFSRQSLERKRASVLRHSQFETIVELFAWKLESRDGDQNGERTTSRAHSHFTDSIRCSAIFTDENPR